MTACPACGGRNPASATWCNQCLTPFAQPEAGDHAAARTGVDDGAAAPGTTPSAAAPAGRQQAEGRADAPADTGVRRRADGTAEWDCPRCGETSSLTLDACPVCGASMIERFGDPRRPAAPTPAPAVLLALTALLPGAGHIACGRVGGGVARAVLYTLWLAGGVAIAAHPARGTVAVAAPMLLGAATLWLASLHDVAVLASNGRQIADGRLLLWLVVGVTGFALLGALASAGGVGLGGPAAGAVGGSGTGAGGA